MAACEWCWQEAATRVFHGGGSVAQEYERVRREQDELGLKARCPMARSRRWGGPAERDDETKND